jgi:ABC-2 type transport system permease protein
LFPLAFISGTFFPVNPASFFGHVARVFPIEPFTKAMFAPFDPRTTGLGFHARYFLVMGIWTVVGVLLAVRRFRWDPKTAAPSRRSRRRG